MPSTTEAVLLILGVLLIIIALAGNAVKAFEIELPAVTGKGARIALLGLGSFFVVFSLWLLVRDDTAPTPTPTPSAESVAASSPTPNTPAATSTPPTLQSATAIVTPQPTTPAQQPTSAPAGQVIEVGQTVTGRLFGGEVGTWTVRGSSTPLDVILDVGPNGNALILVHDAQNIQTAYVDAQSGPEERLINFFVPDGEVYTILVQNSNNTQVDYELTVVRSPPPSQISIGETVQGELYFNEGVEWIFRDGPAAVNITLNVGPHGNALLILKDPTGAEREYVDVQTGPEERLLSYRIPAAGEYRLVVRNVNNNRTQYTLAVQP